MQKVFIPPNSVKLETKIINFEEQFDFSSQNEIGLCLSGFVLEGAVYDQVNHCISGTSKENISKFLPPIIFTPISNQDQADDQCFHFNSEDLYSFPVFRTRKRACLADIHPVIITLHLPIGNVEIDLFQFRNTSIYISYE